MGSLTNQQIDLTYDGLIKTSDEQPISGTLKNLQDGLGNDLPMQVSTGTINFTGTVTGDNNTTYSFDALDATPDATLRLSGSDASTDDVNLIAGTNVTLAVSQNNITINAADDNTTYNLDFVPDGLNATIELNGSDLTTDTITIVPGNNVTFDLATPGQFTINAAGGSGGVTSVNTLAGALTLAAGTGISISDNGSDTITIASTGGASDQIIMPERRFNTAGDNTWNFALPQDGNNYSNGGFSQLIDVAPNRRFFTEIWADSISQVAVLVDTNTFTHDIVVEILDAHESTGMPKDVIATVTCNNSGTGPGFNWFVGQFDPVVTLNYGHYYASIKTTTGSGGGIYAALNAGAWIGRMVEFDVTQTYGDSWGGTSYIGGIYDTAINTGNYPLNYTGFGYRVDMFPTIMFKE